jgi:ubiquinone/menaquinone biosynthesis C-methylase UbiE
MVNEYSKNQQIKNHYDNTINSKIVDYEFHRWFSSINNYLLYKDTYNVINEELSKLNYNSVVEVGAGSGIWSKLLFLNGKNVNLTDIDISKEMINLHKKYFPESNSISYINEDFTTLNIDKFKNKVDLFYSIRCIEYIENFDKLFNNIHKILKNGGSGIVITKKAPLLRKAINHTTNNGMDKLKENISNNNLSIKSIKPVSYQFPVPYLRNLIFITRFTNWFLKFVSRNKITWFNYIFIETYIVVFEKNDN